MAEFHKLVLAFWWMIRLTIAVDHCPQLCHCTQTTTTCQRNNKGFIPDGIPTKSKLISIEGRVQDRQCSQTYVLGTFPKLLFLSMRNNRVRVLCNNTFIGLTSLVKLDLSNNAIDSIQKDAFEGLDHLQELRLDHNELGAIPEGCFGRISTLRTLSLSFNDLGALPTFRDLNTMTSLNLSHNAFYSVPNLSGMTHLEALDLSHNSITQISVMSLRKTKIINFMDLSSNPVSVLASGSFESIRVVELHLNRMPNLIMVDAGSFHNLPVLHVLELNANKKLAYIDPRAFSWVDQLEKIEIIGSGLLAIPFGIKDTLPGLSSISLVDNPLLCGCIVVWAQKLQGLIRLVNITQWTCKDAQQTRVLSELLPLKSSSGCGPIAVLLKDENQDYIRDTSLQYHCRGVGNPHPDVHWRLPNNRLLNDSYASNKLILDNAGTLTILNPTKSDAGAYTCIAQLESKSDSSPVTLNIHNQNVQLIRNDVTMTAITVTWKGTGSSVGWSDYVLLFGLREDDLHVINLRPFMRTYTITNLQPYHLYEFCLALRHKAGFLKLNCLHIQTKKTLARGGFRGMHGGLSILVAIVVFISFASFLCLASCVVRRLRRRQVYKAPKLPNGRVSCLLRTSDDGASDIAMSGLGLNSSSPGSSRASLLSQPSSSTV